MAHTFTYEQFASENMGKSMGKQLKLWRPACVSACQAKQMQSDKWTAGHSKIQFSLGAFLVSVHNFSKLTDSNFPSHSSNDYTPSISLSVVSLNPYIWGVNTPYR